MTHAVVIELTREIVTELFTEGHESPRVECSNGLPEGAVLTGAWVGRGGNLFVRFDHPELPEVLEGAEPPTMLPIFHHPAPEVER